MILGLSQWLPTWKASIPSVKIHERQRLIPHCTGNVSKNNTDLHITNISHCRWLLKKGSGGGGRESPTDRKKWFTGTHQALSELWRVSNQKFTWWLFVELYFDLASSEQDVKKYNLGAGKISECKSAYHAHSTTWVWFPGSQGKEGTGRRMPWHVQDSHLSFSCLPSLPLVHALILNK